MTRRQAIRMLKNEERIECLDLTAYLTFLALRVEIGERDSTVPLADLVKAYEPVAGEGTRQ